MARLFTFATGTYPVVETNQIAAVNTGQIKAQYALDTAIVTAGGAQQGQLLVVDEKAKKVKLPSAGTDYVYLHASEEQIYDSALGRNSFVQKREPKMLKLNVGDTFETNAVDKGAYADRAAVATALAGGVVYGVPMTSGDIKLLAAASIGSETVVLEALEFVKLPNGSEGIKFVVRKA